MRGENNCVKNCLTYQKFLYIRLVKLKNIKIMKKYQVELTCIYNGMMTIEAESEDEALRIAQDDLNYETLKCLPDYVELPNDGYFQFGEATADYAECEED